MLQTVSPAVSRDGHLWKSQYMRESEVFEVSAMLVLGSEG